MKPSITIHFITPDARTTTVTGKVGQSLMEAATTAGIDGIAADCGGTLTCATCHVRVPEPFWSRLPAADAEETSMLAFTAIPAQTHSRLSCQIRLSAELDGLQVELPLTQY